MPAPASSSSSPLAEQGLPHDALLTPRSVRLSQTAPRCPPSEYKTDHTLRRMTRGTRTFSRMIPLSAQHKLRDGGYFRSIADAAVASIAVPMGAVGCPSAAKEFLRLSKRCVRLPYGDHESQFLDLFFPDNNKINDNSSVRGMVFFVHGGAWGSGKPWFYRLIALPFLKLGVAVAIVGYRVYPLCGVPGNDTSDCPGRGGVLTQVDDLEAALDKLHGEYPEWCDKQFEDRYVVQPNRDLPKPAHHLPHLGTVVVGHSSGAHISLLWMVERAQKAIRIGQKDPSNRPPAIDSLISVSGVYNIDHHFEYEGGRGVEEISPLKPANGYDRRSFLENSPPWKIQHEFLRNLHGKMDVDDLFPPRILLIHGAEDDVVPCAGTGEAARILKQSLGGVPSNSTSGGNICIDEVYIPKTGHQDTVVDLMVLGGHEGPVTKTVTDWLLSGNRQLQQRKEERERRIMIQRSKL